MDQKSGLLDAGEELQKKWDDSKLKAKLFSFKENMMF